MKVDLSADAIRARLQRASDLAGSLHPSRRLETKIDLSAEGVARRLKEVAELRDLCRRLAAAGAARR
jgi:CTP-dependent riboflavin kinase